MFSTSEFVVGRMNGPMVRLSFANGLYKPRAINNGVEKYGCTLIVKKSDTEILDALQKAVEECIVGEWGDKGIARAKAGVIKIPILDGSTSKSKKTGELYEGFGDSVVFIRPQSGVERPPAVRWKSPNMQCTEAEVYSGCYGKAVLNAFAWTHPQSGDGVSFGIYMFQKLAEGDRLGGGGPSDVEKYMDTVEDAGSAPAVTRAGGGASKLFG